MLKRDSAYSKYDTYRGDGDSRDPVHSTPENRGIRIYETEQNIPYRRDQRTGDSKEKTKG